MLDPTVVRRSLPATDVPDGTADGGSPATWNLHGRLGGDTGLVAGAEPAAVLDAAAADPLVEAFRTMPSVGDTAFGFALLRELGQGTFGRVFLAAQPDLADRKVVLKVSADLTGESRALAQLQHTNIVPVYSIHRGPRHQAVCMPYFGATTLARLLRHYRETKSLPASGREFVNSFRSLTAPAPSAAVARPDLDFESPPAGTEQLLAILAAGSYTRAVAWLAARLADGLAHAHDRGMIHRDIKPANILLTDDGQPMLLDFGLAEELSRRATVAAGAIGGTLAYMAPEQLNEVRTKRPEAGPGSDLYSLGVVLYELLTGRFPFDETADPEAMIRERTAPPPPVRAHNPEVTPGLESVVWLCLAARPDDRYPSAAALRDDLDRYLADQPLRTAPERSWGERARKWSRRHPRLTSATSLLTLVVAVAAVGSAALLDKRSRLRLLEAEQTFRQFAVESKAAQLTLYARPDDETALAKGEEQGRAAVARYAATDAGWEANQLVAALPPDRQKALRRDLAETYLLLARAAWFRATRGATPDAAGVAEALRYNGAAERLLPDDPPRLVFIQRRTMFAALNRPAEAAAATEALKRSPPRSARDFYYEAAEEYAAGRLAAAAGWYRKAQDADPKAFWSHFGEGACRLAAGEWAAARGCFTAALVIDPDATDARANRAVANLRLGDAAAAEDDATAALAAQPDRADALLTRAEARGKLKKFDAALADADAARAKGATAAALALRETLSREAGWTDPAEPTTAAEWVRHGLKALTKDPAAALDAFDKAVELDPKSVAALLCRAHVLGETRREAECAATLTAVLELDPTNAGARAARGVMRARLTQDAEAVADARAALDTGFAPMVVYQVAGVYARVSARKPEYADEALVLLRIALRAGVGHDLLAADRELDPLRDTPAFRKIAEDARTARPVPPPK